MSSEILNTDTDVNEKRALSIMNEETTQPKEIETIGSLLRTAREKKSLSVDAISRFTKINATSIQALENDDTNSLPNIAYVKGFVKSYSKIVNVDEHRALELLALLYNEDVNRVVTPMPPSSSPQPKQGKQKAKPSPTNTNKNLFKGVAFAVVMLVVLISLLNQSEPSKIESQITEEKIVVKPRTLTANTPLSIQEENKEMKMATEVKDPSMITSPAPIIIEAKKIETKKIETKKIEAKKIEATKPVEKKIVDVVGENKKEELKKEIEFYSLPSPLYTIVEITADEKSKLVPASYQNTQASGKENVFIKAVDGDTWLTYKSDDDPIKKFILKQGRHILIRGNKIRVFLGNVNVTKVFLNNDLLGIKSKSGVKSLAFPKDFAKSLKLPLFVYKKDGSVITSSDYIEMSGN